MVKFGISRTGLGVGWAHPARLPRRTRSFGCVRAAEVTTSPLRVKKLDEESGKYLVNYKGGFNPKFKKRVLGIDGGGVRGLVPATVLITVERVIAEYLLKNYRGAELCAGGVLVAHKIRDQLVGSHMPSLL